MSLQYLLDKQNMFQKTMGTDFRKMDLKEKSKYIHEHGYFLMEETVELLRECPYHKSWKNYDGMTQVEEEVRIRLMKEEAIDALHFLTNIFLALRMDEHEIIRMYNEKNKINLQRQVDPSLGYVKEK